MVRGVGDSGQEAGLCETEFKGTELARKKLDDASDLWRWDEYAVNAMDNAVRSKLGVVSIRLSVSLENVRC